MKDILIVIMNLNMGGAEKSLINMLNEFNREEANIDLLLLKREGLLLDFVPDWVSVLEPSPEIVALYSPRRIAGHIFLKTFRIIATLLSSIETKSDTRKRFIRWRKYYFTRIPVLKKEYDLAVSYLDGESMYYVIDKVNAKEKYTFVHTQYSKNKIKIACDRPYYEKEDKIITISERCKDSIIEAHPQVKNKVFYIPNIVSSSQIKGLSQAFIPKEYNTSETMILSVARLEKIKGIDLAVEAAKELKERGLRFKWFVIGEGSQKSSLAEMINKYELSNHFVLLGTRVNPYPYIGMCDLFVQPSRQEGRSLSLCEAKILARPIVATNYDTIVDQLNENEGVIVEKDGHSICEGIVSLIDNKTKYNALVDYMNNHEYGNADEIIQYKKVMGL